MGCMNFLGIFVGELRQQCAFTTPFIVALIYILVSHPLYYNPPPIRYYANNTLNSCNISGPNSDFSTLLFCWTFGLLVKGLYFRVK